MNIVNVGLVTEPVKSTRTRTYDASRRQAAAEQTRRRILDAARRLFVRDGYAATPVAAVAREAGVSVDTLYTSVGRKPRLLLAVHDMELAGGDEPVAAEQRDYVRAVRAADGAAAKIRTYADALGRRLPHTVPLAEALRNAAESDPECRAQWTALVERRASNMLRFAAELRATGELRPDLDDRRVADLVWTLNSPEYFRLLTSRGHSPEEYADVVADVLTRTLLA